jgi:photosystem II stability/assembly factor-like uncharacterized protein
MKRYAAATALFTLFVVVATSQTAESDPTKEPTLFDALPARNIGPANMGGRIVDVDVVEKDPKIIYVAPATGGLWKTVDGGDTWKSVFDEQTTLCMGAVAVSQSNPDIVWVGTGEANARNSVSWGDGVYKSTDGGKTWKNMGLKETRHIGRVVVHPKNPDIVYVAALGHLWAPNKERGLYKTSDGGKTWQQVKYINEDTGFIDVAIDPSDPEILYASTYCVRRDGFSGGNPKTQTGPQTGLLKTEDGGKTWHVMTEGLPNRPLGRCGLSVYRKNPKIVYAIIQTDKTNVGREGQLAKTNQGDVDLGGVFRSEDKGKTWKKLNDLCPRPFYYGQIRVDPNDDQRIYVLGVQFQQSDDGGKKFVVGGRGTHSDHHALWIDPKDSNHLILGNDGGLFFSKNKGTAWEAIRTLPIGQFYGVAVDMRKPYRVYGGLQDNGSWGGPSATAFADGIALNDWQRIPPSGDGFQAAADPNDLDTVYAESQYGGLMRVNLKDVGKGKDAGGKSMKPKADKNEPAYRFNWNAPILLSPHKSTMIYYGGNYLFKSTDRGDNWEKISPDLTHGKPGVAADFGHTITTIAESPKKAGLLYVGTDDGRLHVSKNDGKDWIDLSEKIPDLPQERWITRVECANFDEGTAYVTIDRHRNDDLKPYIFKTTDYGVTWKPLANNLPPEAPVHVIRESSKNKNLLFAGTENGLFISQDGGQKWQHFTNGLPPAVIVHDLVIHPRDRELVIGTHARSVYVMDIAPLEEMTDKVMASDVYLFTVKPATTVMVKTRDEMTASNGVTRHYTALNPEFGAAIYYYLKTAVTAPPTLTINDGDKKVIARLTGSKDAGLHHVVWNLRGSEEDAPRVEAGDYTVTLKVGEQTLTQKVTVEKPQ